MSHGSHMPVPGIILAAGASRRLGQPKQVLLEGGETLLGRAIRLAHEAGASPVLVVLGAERDSIRETLGQRGDTLLVENDAWQEGIASSIRAGLHAAERRAPFSAGVLLMTCDQPRLTREHLRLLIARFHRQFEPGVVASKYAGTRGVPAILPRSAFPLLEALEGDSGARAILMNPPCAIAEVVFRGGEVDIDRPEDLAQLT